MNPSTLQGAAVLMSGVVVAVFVYLLRTNISRWLRWPLAGIAIMACYTLVKLNSKIVSNERMTADAVAWWENWSLMIVTVLVFVLPLMHWCHEQMSPKQQAAKRSHAQMNAQR